MSTFTTYSELMETYFGLFDVIHVVSTKFVKICIFIAR